MHLRRRSLTFTVALAALLGACAPGGDGAVGELSQANLQCGLSQWWNAAFTNCGQKDPQGSCSYQLANPHAGTNTWWDTDLAVNSSTPVQLRHDSRLVEHPVFAWGFQPTFDDLVTGARFSFLHLRPQNQNTTVDGMVYPSGTVVGLSGGDTFDTGFNQYSTGAHLCINSVGYFRDAFPSGVDPCGCPLPPPAYPSVIRQALGFECGNAMVVNTGDWSGGSFKAECSDTQAMTGLSVSPSLGTAHAALCYNDDQAFFPHAFPKTCHEVVFSGGNAGYTGSHGDWDPFYYKGECANDEFAVGVSQTPQLALTSILCCTGRADHSAPATLVMAKGEAREAGTDVTTGDWDGGSWKGECGPGRYVCGASQDPGSHKPHAVLCCGTVMNGAPQLLSQAPLEALTFDSQNQQRPPFVDWRPGNWKAECGVAQALTGVSKSPISGFAHSALCNIESAALFTRGACHAVVFDAGNAGYNGANGDWDPFFYKGECAANEYVAGISQTPNPHGVAAILCCAGNFTVGHGACAALAMAGKNAIEPGGNAGDWAGGYYKAECGPGRFAVGVSADPATHDPHAILCCGPVAPPPMPDMASLPPPAPDMAILPPLDLGTPSDGGAPLPDGKSPATDGRTPATDGRSADGRSGDGAGEPQLVVGGCGCSVGGAAVAPRSAYVLVALLLGLGGVSRSRRRRPVDRARRR